MSVAILYISTGKYIVFWKEFYLSCEKYFLPGTEKTYFVFTDAVTYDFKENENVKTISHSQLGWPYDTLMRFHTFQKIENELRNFDFIFFFNANMLFLKKITKEEFLPTGISDDGLLVTLHPGYFNQPRSVFPYEKTNPESKAYISGNEGNNYFMGGLNGGKSTEYLQLIGTLKSNTESDLENNIIAAWHDESHLNRYMIGRNPKILSPAFGYPEGRKLPFEPVILIRDKNHYGGHAFLRNIKMSFWERMIAKLKQIFKKS